MSTPLSLTRDGNLARIHLDDGRGNALSTTMLAALEQDLVDVIVLDVMMPDLDGLQVCGRLRQSERTRVIPVILLTASVDAETRVAAMALGVTEFVTKPLNSHDLLARIRAQLHQRKLAGALDEILRRPSS